MALELLPWDAEKPPVCSELYCRLDSVQVIYFKNIIKAFITNVGTVIFLSFKPILNIYAYSEQSNVLVK